ncbi:MAG TPA: ClpXP protease specificity-enhancing factor [Gammaproteobacteria bacterium]|nr:ClpXP protease specificity-enhancing factor [Gammaproteobacteria bacterium]HBK11570.1 ClpXP protease specificity-enhancing factor [Gammaproteobacteria bacterium]
MKPRRPYLLRALYEWIVDCDEVPNILVDTEVAGVVVPTEYVQDGQIVLNISPSAVRDLSLGNEFVMCSGRFAGRSFEITLPIESIRAIYCRDSGQGLAFEDEDFAAAESLVTEQETSVLNPEVAAEETAVKDGDAEKKGPNLRLV